MLTARPYLLTTAVLLLGFAVGWSTNSLQAEPDKAAPLVYELRTYTTEEGRLPALNARFRDHTMKLFEKHGMKNVVYFTPIDKEGKPVDNKLVYLIAHKSVEARTASFAAFGKDPEWVAARNASEKDGKIVSNVEWQLFTPTDYSPMK